MNYLTLPRALIIFLSLLLLSQAAYAAQFTSLAPVTTETIVSNSPAFSKRFAAAHLIDGNPKTEYASKDQGTNTWVEFDFGQPTRILAFRHVDRNDMATIAASELELDDASGKAIWAVPIKHVNQPGGTTFFILPTPVVAQRIKWHVTQLGNDYPAVGGAEISFYTSGESDPAPTKDSIEPDALPCLDREGNQPVTITIQHPYTESAEVILRGAGKETRLRLHPGQNSVDWKMAPVQTDTATPLELQFGDKTIAAYDFPRKPVKPLTIYILPHSHMDIGYAFYPATALRLHAVYILDALKLIAQSRRFPADAQFRWNLECMIEAQEFLKMATPDQRKTFFDAIASGHIGLDGLYCNELTGLCQPEELVQYVAYARQFEEKYHVSIDSAMISDVPSYTWGMVPVLAQAGIRYWSWGPNGSTHIGYARKWDNRPFYWSSPSGTSKVLCWQSCNSYWPAFTPDFPSGLSADFEINAKPFLDFLQQFTASNPNFPYSMIYTRWTTGDNAPPDPHLSAFVARWNHEYSSPHLVIATTSQAFHALDAKYGNSLPTYRGDYNGCWEDGAASTAEATVINRRAANRLSQASMLWAILGGAGNLPAQSTAPKSDAARADLPVSQAAWQYPQSAFNRAWQNIVLYDEHTWGAYCSWSQPYSDFTREQWEWKRRYAAQALDDANKLLQRAKKSIHPPSGSQWFAVFNTSSWPRTSLVSVPPQLALASRQNARGAGISSDVPWHSVAVFDSAGQPVPCQRMPDQSLVFLARDVPGLSAARYQMAPGEPAADGLTPAIATSNVLSNGLITVHINPANGTIDILTAHGIDGNLVNPADNAARGLNDYAYVTGQSNTNVSFSGAPDVRVLASGPLVAELEIKSTAPGCHELVREISLVAGLQKVFITDLLDKDEVWPTLEGVHIGFPFKVPNGVFHYDEPWSVIEPGRDQLPWTQENFFTENRWVDVSNDRFGVTWASVDAPMFELGGITATRMDDPNWILKPEPGTTIFSFVMNNYWLTNYKASQRGMVVFHYVLEPHGPFNQAAAERFGIDSQQPLLTASIAPHAKECKPLFTVEPADVLVEDCHPNPDGQSYSLRIFNAGSQSATVRLAWAGGQPIQMALTDLFGSDPHVIMGPITLASLDSMTLLVTPH
ncbi:MAG TPA: discoidin domain-containing protein [Alphaproteobacteria bacterium]|nr:discoidin domain-containing protein [Alphaproteobacteria bacterium]